MKQRALWWICNGLALALASSGGLGACSSPAQPQPVTPATTATTVSVEEAYDDTPMGAADLDAPLEAKTAAEFATACHAGLERAKEILPQILAARTRSEETVLEPYNELMIAASNSDSMASVIRAVHPDADFREAASKCEQDAQKFMSELSLNRELYDAFAHVDVKALDPLAARLVEHTMRDFHRAGVDKDEATRAKLKEIDEKLVSLGQKFSENITKDVRHITLKSAKELAGLPADYIASHKPAADGTITITTDYPDYIPFMSYADSSKRRKELYIADKSRGGMDNAKLMRDILRLRQEKAHILGYANWADYITEDKMMKSGKAAGEFIDKVAKIARPRGEQDYKELLARKRKDVRRASRVEDWEKDYYGNKVKAESYSFDPQSVRPYFRYTEVEKGLLGITAAMYGIEYRPAKDAPIWHPDVTAYDVYRDGARIGRIYLDMHPREGKYKHAAQYTLRNGVAGEQLPEGVLVCNLPNPRTTDGPALMEHDDVTTMFHEFGHLMHHILGGNQKWVDMSGVSTEWDFVEAPSQMFEEWAWQYETLSRFARNAAGEVIPEALVDRMQKARKFGLGTDTLQQMYYAAISLRFHQIDPDKVELLDLMKELQAKYTPFRYVDGTHFFTNFGHLEGYSAMYYTYMWSLVIAKDMFTPFQEHGLLDTDWTYRYRDQILAPGGTKDAADLVADFLGRPISFDAFQHYLEPPKTR